MEKSKKYRINYEDNFQGFFGDIDIPNYIREDKVIEEDGLQKTVVELVYDDKTEYIKVSTKDFARAEQQNIIELVSNNSRFL